MDEWDERGQHIYDDILLLLLNPEPSAVAFKLPEAASSAMWEPLLDSSAGVASDTQPALAPGAVYPLEAHSLALLRLRS
jgi:hypothetical protein